MVIRQPPILPFLPLRSFKSMPRWNSSEDEETEIGEGDCGGSPSEWWETGTAGGDREVDDSVSGQAYSEASSLADVDFHFHSRSGYGSIN